MVFIKKFSALRVNLYITENRPHSVSPYYLRKVGMVETRR